MLHVSARVLLRAEPHACALRNMKRVMAHQEKKQKLKMQLLMVIPGTVGFKTKSPDPKNPLGPKQTRTVGHP